MASAGGQPPLRVGLIGLGAIGRPLAAAIAAGQAGAAQVVAALVRDPGRHDGLPGGGLLTADAAAFFVQPLDVVVEAAGHAALRQYGEAALRAGADLLVVSVGAFADDALLARRRRPRAAGFSSPRGRSPGSTSSALPRSADWTR